MVGKLKWVFAKKPRPGQIDAPGTAYWAHKWMEAFGDLFIILTGLLMLYGPMWWLDWISKDNYRLAIITSFVTLFAFGLRLISGSANPFEALAATAAQVVPVVIVMTRVSNMHSYAAVLMVFMQQQG